MNPDRPSPRSLPTSADRRASFTPRRSYARARASKERVETIARIEKNKKSQEKFARWLKIVVNGLCVIGILALIVYALFFSSKPANPKGLLKEQSLEDRLTPAPRIEEDYSEPTEDFSSPMDFDFGQ